MAEELTPGTPEVTDPVLIADLLQFLSVRGSLGRLPLADVVLPVINLGDVRTTAVDVRSPAFRSTDVFSAGKQTAAGANTIHADTTALAAGVYDAMVSVSTTFSSGNLGWLVQHRDAANAATLAEWPMTQIRGNSGIVYSFGYELGVNERLRILNDIAISAGEASCAFIFARVR